MRGTLSAWSWPSREIAFMKRQSLDINKPCVKFTVTSLTYCILLQVTIKRC